jgi:urease accessory protein
MLVEAVLGNTKDVEWSARLNAAHIDSLRLDQWEAQKNRLRKQTDDGTEVALSLQRGTRLHDGDILVWLEDQRTAVVAAIDLGEVMVVDVDTSAAASAEGMVRAAIELGHALGNQHWPAVVKGTTVYVPLTIDRQVMASVMKTHSLPGVSYDFVPGTEVIAFLAPHEARRLFGGADSTPHSHATAEPA